MATDTQLTERLTLLQSIPFFQDLETDQLRVDVANIMETVVFKKGQAIIREGEIDRFLYVVAEGEADVMKMDVKLMTLKRGDFLGLGNLLEGKPHSASVVASTSPTSLYILAHDAFSKLLSSNAAMSLSLCRYLTKELRAFRTKLADVADHSKTTNVTRIALYDSKEYDHRYFDLAVEHYNNENEDSKLEVKYFPVKLSLETTGLSAGAAIVCIFVNDDASAPVLARLCELGVKMLALRCAGFNQVDLKAALALNISVARVPAYSPYAVAEHCVALLQTLNRKTHLAYNRVKSGNFSLSNLVGKDIHGRTVGVIGTGKIGYCLIQIMIGFGCKILCYDLYKNKDLENNPLVKYVELDELLSQSHVISIHCPLTPQTKHMIDKDAIAKMPKGVIIINTSRGALIKSVDLISGLKSGHIGGAGLDVYEDESEYFFEDRSASVISDDVLARLMTFNNVLITSHQAFLTEEALTAIANVTVSNIREFIVEKKQLKELSNSVNL